MGWSMREKPLFSFPPQLCEYVGVRSGWAARVIEAGPGVRWFMVQSRPLDYCGAAILSRCVSSGRLGGRVVTTDTLIGLAGAPLVWRPPPPPPHA